MLNLYALTALLSINGNWWNKRKKSSETVLDEESKLIKAQLDYDFKKYEFFWIYLTILENILNNYNINVK